jgi:4-diphosphocytidyl-2-C-methyl-D-erythritol kinase
VGGGSSDAAAALRLLRAWWRCVAEDEIQAAAPGLGSDVAFFLRGGVQLGSGRGELLTPLPDPPRAHLVLFTPPITLPAKTAELYGRLTPAHFTDGARSRRLAEKLRSEKAPSAADYFNIFDAVADDVFSGLREYRRALEDAAGAPALLAGAGPSLFAICRDAEHAAAAVDELTKRHRLHAHAVTTVGVMQSS